MGQRVGFPSNGHTCQGYLATPSSVGPAVADDAWNRTLELFRSNLS